MLLGKTKIILDTDIKAQKTNRDFYFFLPIHGRENIVFESNLRNADFDGFISFVPLESENRRLVFVCLGLLSA